MNLSIVVIACRNDIAGIERTLDAVCDLHADVLLYDTSGTGQSRAITNHYAARLIEANWEGYDVVRYKAGKQAFHDWILMLHTGESPDEKLRQSLRGFSNASPDTIYRIRFKNLFGNKWLNHGEWGGYSHVRLANQTGIQLQEEKVNEQLLLRTCARIRTLRGHILHTTSRNKEALVQRLKREACIAAIKYYRKGRKAGFGKQFLSAIGAFIKDYFLKLGFMDGKEGYTCTRLDAQYCFMKYQRLRQLNRNFKKQL